jgi:hypothetical protein
VTIDQTVNYDLRQYALWVAACVGEHGGSAALASWEQIEKVINSHDALLGALASAHQMFEDIRHGFPVSHYGPFHANGATMSACRDAIDRIDLALANASHPKVLPPA